MRYFKNFLRIFLNIVIYVIDYIKFNKINDKRFILKIKNIQPCIFENTFLTEFDRHYIYHTAWAARKVKEINPEIHHDFSSSLYFISIISTFYPVVFYDYRPANLQLEEVTCLKGDLRNLLIDSESLKSVSCMHVIEHIGLGRYGDELDPIGDLKGIKELQRVTIINGDILFVVPMGSISIIKYNANRIYTYEQVIEYFNKCELVDFTLITDYKFPVHLIKKPNNEILNAQIQGCGCFHFKKIKK